MLNNTVGGLLSSGSSPIVRNAFLAGATSTTVQFAVQADDIPEATETIAVQITGVTSPGAIATPNTAYIVIPANDDPNGVIGFQSVSGR